VYSSTSYKTVWIRRRGANQSRKLASGTRPEISPDGQRVVFQRCVPIYRWPCPLYLVNSRGGRAKLLLRRAADYEWAPDSRRLAITVSNSEQRETLWVLDLDADTRIRRDEAAAFLGLTFSPDSLLLARGRKDRPGPLVEGGIDIYVGASDGGGDARQLTADGGSLSPVWSPDHFLVFSRFIPKSAPIYPRYRLRRIDTNGENDELLSDLDLEALAWSNDGTRLLATSSSEVGSYPYAVSAGSWNVRRLPVRGAEMFTRTLSADGSLVLAEWYSRGKSVVGVIPWNGRGGRILVRGAVAPHWNW
jgi:Tol biopolymer transport system component